VAATDKEIVDILASLSLFSDLSRPQLEAVTHTMEEEWFAEGQRIVRQGLSGTGFYLILDGEATVRRNGKKVATSRSCSTNRRSAMWSQPGRCTV
jgi:CRP-like cAMP-binding protein